jgi:hypothetical protein
LAELGFECRALYLLGKQSTTWSTLLALFALAIFDIGSHFMPKLA